MHNQSLSEVKGQEKISSREATSGMRESKRSPPCLEIGCMAWGNLSEIHRRWRYAKEVAFGKTQEEMEVQKNTVNIISFLKWNEEGYSQHLAAPDNQAWSLWFCKSGETESRLSQSSACKCTENRRWCDRLLLVWFHWMPSCFVTKPSVTWAMITKDLKTEYLLNKIWWLGSVLAEKM